MAVQSKTLINDVGSAVLDEAVSQLNRAAGYVSSPLAATLGAAANNYVLCRFSEDVYITSVEFGFGGAGGSFNQIPDRVSLVSGTDPDGTGGTEICAAASFAAVPFVTTDVWATITSMQASALTDVGSDAPFALDAGNALTLRIFLDGASTAGGAILESYTVTYRPIKDGLTLSPSYTQTMQNFTTVNR